jgi:hypothetical protein
MFKQKMFKHKKCSNIKMFKFENCLKIKNVQTKNVQT